MAKIYIRTSAETAKKTLAIFCREMAKDKKSVLIYSTIIPLNRVLYIVILPLLFSFIIQSLIQEPHNWQHPLALLFISAIIAVII